MMAHAAVTRASVGEVEWKTRIDLAACYRLLAHFGMTEMVSNHVSARVPGTEDILLNPFGFLYQEITASSLIRIDIAGNILHNPHADYSINQAGYVLHSAIHEARPEVGCVIHTHTPYGTALSTLECGLLPVSQSAMRFGKVAYHEFQGVVFDEDEKTALVRNLGDAEVMVLRNHGLAACGPTIAQAFNSMYRLERICQVQMIAMAANSPIRMPSEEVVKKSNGQYAGNRSAVGLPATPLGEMEWRAMLRLLDAQYPGYER